MGQWGNGMGYRYCWTILGQIPVGKRYGIPLLLDHSGPDTSGETVWEGDFPTAPAGPLWARYQWGNGMGRRFSNGSCWTTLGQIPVGKRYGKVIFQRLLLDHSGPDTSGETVWKGDFPTAPAGPFWARYQWG